MGFLAPFMLFGAAAAGIPLALHFFYRARYKPVPWGAMKFLRLAVEQTSRRLRFQELVLLLLRILVMVAPGARPGPAGRLLERHRPASAARPSMPSSSSTSPTA